MPLTRESWLEGGFLDWDYHMVGIVVFRRHEFGFFSRVKWQFEEPTTASFFKKIP